MDIKDILTDPLLHSVEPPTDLVHRAQNIVQVLLMSKAGQIVDEAQLKIVFDMFFSFEIFKDQSLRHYFDPKNKE